MCWVLCLLSILCSKVNFQQPINFFIICICCCCCMYHILALLHKIMYGICRLCSCLNASNQMKFAEIILLHFVYNILALKMMICFQTKYSPSTIITSSLWQSINHNFKSGKSMVDQKMLQVAYTYYTLTVKFSIKLKKSKIK